MAVSAQEVRETGRFGDHIPDTLIDRCIAAAAAVAQGYALRIPAGVETHFVRMLACHFVCLTERQPLNVRQDALMISYEALGGPGGLHETSFGREVERILQRRPRVI